MADNLRYAMVLRPSDSATMISGSISSNSSAYLKEASKIKTKMIEAGLRPNERKKIVSQKTGNWMCECDANNILFVCLVADTYSERLAYGFLNEMRKGVSELSNYFAITPEEMEKGYKGKLDELQVKYNDPASFDSMSSVNSKVDLAKTKMEKSMQQALQNQQDLNNVNAKTENVLNLAKDLEKNSDELKKIMYWRNMKLKMIMTVMGGAGCFAVVLPIIQKFA